MRIAIGEYKGMTAEELVEQDPRYAEWFWQDAEGEPMELRQEVRAVLAESRLARLSDQYDREVRCSEALKRQHAEGRIRVPCAEEISAEKVKADRLQRELASVLQVLAEKDREMGILTETFKKLRSQYARIVCPPEGG